MISLKGWGRTGSLLAGAFYNKSDLNKWLVLFIEIALILLLAQQLAKISWFAIEQYRVPSTSSSVFSVAALKKNQAVDSNQYIQLQELQLFGKPVITQAALVKSEPVNVEQIPVSQLRAKVTGLVAHADASRALAVIDNGGRQKTYQIGDDIYKSSATIESILWDRVIINNRGKQEALLLYPNDPESRSQSVRKQATTSPVSNLKALRQQVLTNPASLAEMVSISPVRSGGELKGYRINPKQYQQLFTSAGLKPNDLATAINGYDLTDPAQAMEVLNQLKSLDQVALTVERQGQLYQIDLSL